MDLMDILFPLPSWLMLIIVVLGLYFYHLTSTFNTFKKMGIAGPKPIPIFGNLLYVFKHGIFKAVTDGYEHYKDRRMYGTFEGRLPILMVTDLDMSKEILIKQFNNFTNRRQYAAMNQKGIDSIIFNLMGKVWKEYRALLRPALSPTRLKAMSPRLNEPCTKMLSVINKKMEKDSEVEIAEIISCLCMDLFADFAYDVKCDSLQNPSHTFIVTCQQILESFGKWVFTYEFFAPPFLKPIIDALDIRLLPKKQLTFLRSLTLKALDERRRQVKSERQEDLLQYMLETGTEDGTGKRKFTEEEMVGASLTYLLAGYDTSAKGFAYCFYQLIMNPECYKKAQREVDEVLNGEFPTMENVQNLKYLVQCIYEGNRLIPLGPFIERVCINDTTVLGQPIPGGMVTRIPVAGIHRDPDIYPDPERFDPDRFSADKMKSRHPIAFLPFGVGPRACFGQPLAMMILKIGMAALLQAFDMEPCSKSVYPMRLAPLSTVTADHELWVRITPHQRDSYTD